MSDLMTVSVLDRSTWGTNLPYPMLRHVTISKICPCCGGKRGEPKVSRQYDNGDWRDVHTWRNPCGHIDKYSEVLKEASKLEEAA